MKGKHIDGEIEKEYAMKCYTYEAHMILLWWTIRIPTKNLVHEMSNTETNIHNSHVREYNVNGVAQNH